MALDNSSKQILYHEDAFVGQNRSLRQIVNSNRKELRKFLFLVQQELRQNPKSTKFGEFHTPRSIGVSRNSESFIGELIGELERCFNDYEMPSYELWFGTGDPVRKHNDAPYFLDSGQSVALQFWLLLDSHMIDDVEKEPEIKKNNLECIVPWAPGLIWGSMYPEVLTPDGFIKHQEAGIVGGDDLCVGDVLIFKNGVVHCAKGNKNVFRSSLAFRAYRKADRPFHEENFKLWFRDVLLRDKDLCARLKATDNYYFNTVMAEIDKLPSDAKCDYSSLKKNNRNNFSLLRKRFAEFAFKTI